MKVKVLSSKSSNLKLSDASISDLAAVRKFISYLAICALSAIFTKSAVTSSSSSAYVVLIVALSKCKNCSYLNVPFELVNSPSAKASKSSLSTKSTTPPVAGPRVSPNSNSSVPLLTIQASPETATLDVPVPPAYFMLAAISVIAKLSTDAAFSPTTIRPLNTPSDTNILG